MCGLVGMAFNREVKRTEADLVAIKGLLTELLMQAQIRGSDAAGVSFLDVNGKITVEKDGVAARKFVESKAYKKLQITQDTTVILGHTRAGTHGSAAYNRNNHPLFSDVEPRVSIAHNGVISNHKELANKLGIQLKGEVDSEILLRIAELSREGDGVSHSAFTQLAELVTGSVACTLIDSQHPYEVILLKDGVQPLVYASSAHLGVLAWASTSTILERALGGKVGRPWHWAQLKSTHSARIDTRVFPWTLNYLPFDNKRTSYSNNTTSYYKNQTKGSEDKGVIHGRHTDTPHTGVGYNWQRCGYGVCD